MYSKSSLGLITFWLLILIVQARHVQNDTPETDIIDTTVKTLKGRCEPCKHSNECESGKCWGKPLKCVPRTWYNDLYLCGFGGECKECTHNDECATLKCWGPGGGVPSKCVFNYDWSKERCFPETPKKIDDCYPCKRNSDCKSGKCWGHPLKCVPGSLYEDLLKCEFKPECADCSKDGECATHKCWGPGHGVHPKCVFEATKDKCFKKPDCAPCKMNSDCLSGKCWGHPLKCVPGSTYDDLIKCEFKPECADCSKDGECATHKCWGPGHGVHPKCVFEATKDKCFKKPDCSPCKKNTDCLSGKCWGHPLKCVGGSTYDDLIKCDFKPECAECTKDGECATHKCWGPGHGIPPKCVYEETKDKCFKKPNCEPCKKNLDCLSGKCWGHPLLCVGPTYNDLITCGFKKKCDTCTKDGECATKKCYGGYCVETIYDKCPYYY